MTELTPVRLPTFQFSPVPVKLANEIKLTRQLLDRKLSTRVASKDDLAAGRAYAAQYVRGAREAPTSIEARGLVGLYAQGAASERALYGRILATSPGIAPRRIFAAWQLRGTGFEDLSRALHYAVLAPAEAKLPRWWPRWLDSVEALLAPEPRLGRWIARERIPFHALSSWQMGVMLSVGVGEATVRELVRSGPAAWWTLTTPREARATAERVGLEIQVVVADRQLRDLAGGATNPAELPGADEESTALTQWCLHHFGEPTHNSGPWSKFTHRGREVMEWLLLRDEFGRIIEEFRKHAEQDRAGFWAAYLRELRDARYYLTPSGVAVCMMVFSNCMIIEFGTTGNAAYVYHAPGVRLRARPLGMGLEAADFKDRGELVLAGMKVGFIEKWAHVGAWDQGFNLRLRQRRIYRGGAPRGESLRVERSTFETVGQPRPRPPGEETIDQWAQNLAVRLTAAPTSQGRLDRADELQNKLVRTDSSRLEPNVHREVVPVESPKGAQPPRPPRAGVPQSEPPAGRAEFVAFLAAAPTRFIGVLVARQRQLAGRS